MHVIWRRNVSAIRRPPEQLDGPKAHRLIGVLQAHPQIPPGLRRNLRETDCDRGSDHYRFVGVQQGVDKSIHDFLFFQTDVSQSQSSFASGRYVGALQLCNPSFHRLLGERSISQSRLRASHAKSRRGSFCRAEVRIPLQRRLRRPWCAGRRILGLTISVAFRGNNKRQTKAANTNARQRSAGPTQIKLRVDEQNKNEYWNHNQAKD